MATRPGSSGKKEERKKESERSSSKKEEQKKASAQGRQKQSMDLHISYRMSQSQIIHRPPMSVQIMSLFRVPCPLSPIPSFPLK
jgi:hypothetical protein